MYNRISIVGGCGSGKSTLSNILSEKLNLPVLHLDSINFNANWIEVNKAERDKKILSKTAEDKWIIDGNYTQTLKNRFDKADLIIWLDYSTPALLRGVLKRFLIVHNSERPEIPGCKEHLDFEFLKYVARYNKTKRLFIQDNLCDVPNDKVLIFKKRKDLNKWLINFNIY